MTRKRTSVSVVPFLLVLAGCVGGSGPGLGSASNDETGSADDDDDHPDGDDDDADDDSGSGSTGGTSGSSDEGDVSSDGTSEAGDGGGDRGRPYREPELDETPLPARVWRLTHAQYRNAVSSLLGVEVDIREFATEVDNGIFPNFAAVSFVNDELALDYFEAAREVAESTPEERLLAFTEAGSFGPTQAEPFIARLTEAAFRRPSTPEEQARYREIYDLATSGGSSDPSMPYRTVLRGVLTSPHFLYRAEYGSPELTGYEVASLLSFSLLDEPPSADLMALAAEGALDSEDGVRDAVEELLEQPQARTVAQRFLGQWLELTRFDSVEKFEDVFPGFAEVRTDMELELQAFLDAHGDLTDGTFEALLTEPLPSVSDALDTYYLGEGVSSPRPRIGVLALGTVLAQHGKPNLSSPTLRGLFVRDRFLCQHVELPPGFNPPPLSETEESESPETTRELYELHADDPTCWACHALLDPIGFNMEEYDGGGRLRRLENGHAIDTEAILEGTDVDGPIADTAELAAALASSEWVRECMASQAFRYYLGTVEPSRGFPAIVDARVEAGSDIALQPLIAALMSSASLRERTVEE